MDIEKETAITEYEEVREKFGWVAVNCECGAESMVDLDHTFGFNNNKVSNAPGTFFTFACMVCDKRYNIKIDVWEA